MKEQSELFVLQLPKYPYKLHANDVIRFNGNLGRVVRVNDCAAVVQVNRRTREFKTRFDKPVKLRPSPIMIRISANSEIKILNGVKKRKRKEEREDLQRPTTPARR